MADTEKITVNLSAVDLGRIDLLADEGFYSNRTDFIRTAIRKALDAHRDVVEKSATRRSSVIGVAVYTRRDLEAREQRHQQLDVNVIGGAYFAPDVPPDLARRTIRSLKVFGVLRASPAVRDALADRIE